MFACRWNLPRCVRVGMFFSFLCFSICVCVILSMFSVCCFLLFIYVGLFDTFFCVCCVCQRLLCVQKNKHQNSLLRFDFQLIIAIYIVSIIQFFWVRGAIHINFSMHLSNTLITQTYKNDKNKSEFRTCIIFV